MHEMQETNQEKKVGWVAWDGRDRSLTGACMVLEGTHAVSMCREGAHSLPGISQPALDSPVCTARVQEPVCEL